MISVADLIVRHLRRAGVGFLFGVPGGGSNLDLIDAAGRARLPFILTATETAAALAAIAQAEVRGRPGACLTTLGPGVTSVVNGVACAWLDRAPLLVFTDRHPASAARFAHQRVDHRALFAPITKWSATLAPDNADAVMREAIDRAMAEPRGPVHLECPADVLSVEAMEQYQADIGVHAFEDEPGRVLLDPAALAPMLSGARRPLLLVGLGARQPLDAASILALCASRGVPAMVTYKAKGVVPDADPHYAGVFTNGRIERPIVEDADLLLGIGLDPIELIPRPWTYQQRIVHIGRSPVDDRHVPFAAQLVTDIPSGMQLAGELLPRSSWDLDAVHRTLVAQRQQVCPRCERLSAHRVVQIAADAAAARARVTVDAGAHMFPATMLWPVAEPNGMLISNGLSTMGFALPAAIGAALADREGAPGAIHDHDAPVIALTGDGGLLMCSGELLTAVRERLRIIVIVFADASLSLIDLKQQQRRHPSSGVALGAIDWCALAHSVGAAAHRADTEDDLNHALSRALAHHGPTVIEARIDPVTYADTLHSIRG
ncbi:MAG: acetolactate synthase [Acidobacteria bacterium]|nr:acetolactate synthase [Acidobacteriota bacterium]